MALRGGLIVAAVLAATAPVAHAQSGDLAGERKSLEAVCSKCHNLQLVMDTPKSIDEWQDTLQAMVDRGAQGTDSQFDDIMDYLHRTMTTINVNAADADELRFVLNVSDEAAKAIVTRRATKKIRDLSDLKTVPGVDAAALGTKARFIFF
jgi:competence protein ComEA